MIFKTKFGFENTYHEEECSHGFIRCSERLKLVTEDHFPLHSGDALISFLAKIPDEDQDRSHIKAKMIINKDGGERYIEFFVDEAGGNLIEISFHAEWPFEAFLEIEDKGRALFIANGEIHCK